MPSAGSGAIIPNMSVTIQLDLPDALVKEARANGLLNSAPLGDLLAAELRRRKAAADLNRVKGSVLSIDNSAASAPMGFQVSYQY